MLALTFCKGFDGGLELDTMLEYGRISGLLCLILLSFSTTPHMIAFDLILKDSCLIDFEQDTRKRNLVQPNFNPCEAEDIKVPLLMTGLRMSRSGLTKSQGNFLWDRHIGLFFLV